MSKLRKKYTKAEKLEIVKLSLSDDVQVTDLAERFGVVANTIYNWRSRYYKEHGIASGGQGVKKLSEEEQQIADLKKQLREAHLERDILKKAISIFSKSDGKFTGS
ncbi:MAG: transposase [Lewinella sp.]|uniref:transposase n=1 Tax=Lewinella sp. TaxID=2004506 RepID=UPI003D6AF235